MASKSVKKIWSVDYEVFGNVQGVFFRKFTQDKARELGLVGWVRNTFKGTVEGSVQGPEDKIKVMKDWLSREGSPYSHIDRCEFRNEKRLLRAEFPLFDVCY